MLRELYAFNLTEQQLRERFVVPHDEGRPITWGGRTLPAGDLSYLHVAFSGNELDDQTAKSRFKEYDLFKSASDVTNTWITQAPGSAAPKPPSSVLPHPVDRLIGLCRRFDIVRRQLLRRHDGRSTIQINDEYDVQDLMHALLLMDFMDVRAESWNPPYLGGASRTDFLMPQEGVVVEIKKTRATLLDRQVGSELAEDVTRYSDPAANRGASTLVCFVHDPEHLLTNPVGLEKDLGLTSNDRLTVVGVVG